MSFCEQAITPANILASAANYIYELEEVPTEALIESVNATIEGDFDITDILNTMIGNLIDIVERIEDFREE